MGLKGYRLWVMGLLDCKQAPAVAGVLLLRLLREALALHDGVVQLRAVAAHKS